jgi:hypothetical protein
VNNLTLPAGYELFTQTPSGAEDALSPAAQSTEGYVPEENIHSCQIIINNRTVNTNYSGGLTPGIFGSDTDIGSMLSPWGSGPVTPVVNVDLTSMANMKGCKPSNHNTEQDICPEYHQPHPSLLPQRNDQGTSGALYTPQNAIDFILEYVLSDLNVFLQRNLCDPGWRGCALPILKSNYLSTDHQFRVFQIPISVQITSIWRPLT